MARGILATVLGPAHRRRRAASVRCAAGLLAVPLALGGCSGDGRSHDDAAEREEPAASVPARTVAAHARRPSRGDDGGAGRRRCGPAPASSTFFEAAPVVVLAGRRPVRPGLAASAMIALGGRCCSATSGAGRHDDDVGATALLRTAVLRRGRAPPRRAS